MALDEKILRLLEQKNYSPLDPQAMARRLHVKPGDVPHLEKALEQLERTGRIARIRNNRFTLPREADLIPGRIMINRGGGGALVPDDPQLGRIEIFPENTSTALHMDRVLVRRDVRPGGRRKDGEAEPRGKVIRVLERAREKVVGTLQRSKQFHFIIPDDPRIPHDIYVPSASDGKKTAQAGDKVVVELVEWLSRHNNPEGRIVEVLGHRDDTGVDMAALLAQYNLPDHFPNEAVREAEQFGDRIHSGELKGRRDCRRQKVITIDPDDAKDFDDAICLEAAGNGQWKLWVHIADVSNYVKPGNTLDAEARRRGNSTYLVDRVIPMLPEALSNELCSLKPDVERLTKCVEFLIGTDGRVLKTDFYSAVIHSKRRFTYQEAFAILQNGSPGNDIEKMLVEANRLGQKIRRARFKAGALDLDVPENKIRLDERGRVARIEKVENDISHQLIEEFMLLANEAVAARLKQLQRVAVYRIHENPDPEKLAELREEVRAMGLRCGDLTHKREAQKFLDSIKGHPAEVALRISFLRSLKRARYAIEPLGHYGLAKKNYTHFTSPIRRYSDLVVHRALFDRVKTSRQDLALTADHISFTERNSADAEQDSKTIKLMAFLEQQLKAENPETYDAVVTDVRNFGFFVEVDALGLSGVVRVSTLEDDFYKFDERNNRLVGRRHKRVIGLGDPVKVQIGEVDHFKKHVNFRLVGKSDGGKQKRRGR